MRMINFNAVALYFKLWAILGLLLIATSVQASDILGPDDVVRITVFGHDDLLTEGRISSDGRITMRLIGEINAKDKTNFELEKIIADKLEKGGYIYNPQVIVTVLERVSQQVSVLGYVNKPGRFTLDSETSLLDLIAMAGGVVGSGVGGTMSLAGDNKAIISRNENGKMVKYEVNIKDLLESPESTPKFKMQQGDIVYIPKAPVFYIYGEVMRPGSYQYEPDLNVVKSLTLGGGITLRGSENRITIKRKDSNGVLQILDANLDTPILKDDIIFIGERWF